MANAHYYCPVFHAGAVNAVTPLGTLTLSRVGSSNIVIDLGAVTSPDLDGNASQFFWHMFRTAAFSVQSHDPFGTYRFRHFSQYSWGRAVENAANALATSLSWPTSDFAFTWYEDLGGFIGALPSYSLTYGSVFRYQFSTLAGANLFGVNSVSLSASSTPHVIAVTPSYCLFPSTQAISAPSDEFMALDYEARDIASLVTSDNGIAYGNSRIVAPLYRDWLHQFEPAAKVKRALATAPAWTHQHLVEHCRTQHPFYVAHGQFGSGSEYEVFMLRDEGASWKPQRASTANNVYFHVPYRTLSVGNLVAPS